MDLVFNIIFTSGTVRYLRLAVLTLLEFSPYRYRLIANGLDRKEIVLLNKLCQTNPRLDLYVYPSKHTLSHGTMLSLLERQNKNEYFCFMDSDIFATKDFKEDLESQLNNCDVFSSGNYIWNDPDDKKIGYSGASLLTPTGLPLATTFFCVYRHDLLRRIIADTEVCFERYYFSEQIPVNIIKILDEMNIQRRKFDTGKLINIIGHYYDQRLKHISLEGVNHIGGVSLMLPQLNSNHRVKQFFHRMVPAFDFQDKKGILKRPKKKTSRNRRRIGKFFAEYIKYLFNENKKPIWSSSNGKIDQQVTQLCGVLDNIYEKHRASL